MDANDEVRMTNVESGPKPETQTEAAGSSYPGLEPEAGPGSSEHPEVRAPAPPEPMPRGMVWIGKGVGTLIPVIDEEMAKVLAHIRAAGKPNPLYGRDQVLCDKCLKQITDPLLCGAGLGMVILNEYRWFVRELSRILRNDRGTELGPHLELLILKWNNFGLESHTMQFLICEVFKRFRKMQTPEQFLHDLPGDERPRKEASRARKAQTDTS
ncbi:hypothetical protein FJY69_06475 [candidate division WOR-3 bacterium]|nr:hypothetical protein [candidate division WOR-3 bacterium]